MPFVSGNRTSTRVRWLQYFPLNLFSNFTEKLTRGLSLLLVFNLLFFQATVLNDQYKAITLFRFFCDFLFRVVETRMFSIFREKVIGAVWGGEIDTLEVFNHRATWPGNMTLNFPRHDKLQTQSRQCPRELRLHRYYLYHEWAAACLLSDVSRG